MIEIKNLFENDDVRVIERKGPFTTFEYKRDLSVMPGNAASEWFNSQMNVRRRQLFCDLKKGSVTVQAGAMQWMAGDVVATTGIKGAGDLFRKVVGSSVTNESAIKPEYRGTGCLFLEPTYKHLLLLDLAEWNGAMLIEDGMFLACSGSVKHSVVARTNVSSALAGDEGLFNLQLSGTGYVCLESWVPKEELIKVVLTDDVLKIDGSLAVAWSSSLDFSVGRSGKTLIGSAVSGEGLVNIYKGTGMVLMSPVQHT